MASPSTLPLLPVAPLDGESGYLRWKESVLLRLHTLGLAHVLSDEEGGEKQRVRDDALCRGHILATLSDRLLPAYAHHATAGAVWHAVERTYDLDSEENMSWKKASDFRYDEGEPLLEQLALQQALATVGWPGRLDEVGRISYFLQDNGFPPGFVRKVAVHDPPPCTDKIWEIARKHVVADRLGVTHHAQPTTDGQRSSSPDGFRPPKRARRQSEVTRGRWKV